MLKKLEKKTRWDWEQKARDNAEKVIVTPMNDAGLWSIIYADGSVYSEYHNPNMYYVEPSLESIATYYYQAREVDTCIDSDSSREFMIPMLPMPAPVPFDVPAFGF